MIDSAKYSFGQNRVAGQLRPNFTWACGQRLFRQFYRVTSVALHVDEKLLAGLLIAVGKGKRSAFGHGRFGGTRFLRQRGTGHNATIKIDAHDIFRFTARSPSAQHGLNSAIAISST